MDIKDKLRDTSTLTFAEQLEELGSRGGSLGREEVSMGDFYQHLEWFMRRRFSRRHKW